MNDEHLKTLTDWLNEVNAHGGDEFLTPEGRKRKQSLSFAISAIERSRWVAVEEKPDNLRQGTYWATPRQRSRVSGALQRREFL